MADPRDPNVDAIDWVERIPLSETRNYVQRVIEDVHVYDARFEFIATATSNPDHASANSEEVSSAQLCGTPNLCFAVTFRLTSPSAHHSERARALPRREAASGRRPK